MPIQRNFEKEQEALLWIRNPNNYDRLTPAIQSIVGYVLGHLKSEDPWGDAAKDYNLLSDHYKISRSALTNRVLSAKNTWTSKKICPRCKEEIPFKSWRLHGDRICKICEKREREIKTSSKLYDYSHLTVRLDKQDKPNFLCCIAIRRLDKEKLDRMEFENINNGQIFLPVSSIIGLIEEKKGCWIHLTKAKYFCEDSKPAVKAAMQQETT